MTPYPSPHDDQPDAVERVRVSSSRRPLLSAVAVIALVSGLVGMGVAGRIEAPPAPAAPSPVSDPPSTAPSPTPASRPVAGLGITGVVPPAGSVVKLRLAADASLTAMAAAGHRFYYVADGGSVIRLVDPVDTRLDLPLTRLASGHQAVALAAAGDWLAWVELWTATGTCGGEPASGLAWRIVLANVVTGLGGPVLQGPSGSPSGMASGTNPCATPVPLIALSRDAIAYTVSGGAAGSAGDRGAVGGIGGASTVGSVEGAGAAFSAVEVHDLSGRLLWTARSPLAVRGLQLAGADTLAVVGTAPGSGRLRASTTSVVVIRSEAPAQPIVTLPTSGGVALSRDASTLLFDSVGAASPGGAARSGAPPVAPPGGGFPPGSVRSAVWSVALSGAGHTPVRLAPTPTATPGTGADAPTVGSSATDPVALWREGTPDGLAYPVVAAVGGAARAILDVPAPMWASVQRPWAYWVSLADGSAPRLYAVRLTSLGIPDR